MTGCIALLANKVHINVTNEWQCLTKPSLHIKWMCETYSSHSHCNSFGCENKMAAPINLHGDIITRGKIARVEKYMHRVAYRACPVFHNNLTTIWVERIAQYSTTT